MKRTPQMREREKQEKRISLLYTKSMSGVQINVMDIGKVFTVGIAAIEKNPAIDDAALTKVLVAFVNTIKKN